MWEMHTGGSKKGVLFFDNLHFWIVLIKFLILGGVNGVHYRFANMFLL